MIIVWVLKLLGESCRTKAGQLPRHSLRHLDVTYFLLDRVTTENPFPFVVSGCQLLGEYRKIIMIT